MVIFDRYVNVYQRVRMKHGISIEVLWDGMGFKDVFHGISRGFNGFSWNSMRI
jgi:hypothetical protein